MRAPLVDTGLPIGRPKNRRRRYAGDRRAILDEKVLWGPDAHGVFWAPVRAYYDAGPDETLVAVAPVHPDALPAELKGGGSGDSA